MKKDELALALDGMFPARRKEICNSLRLIENSRNVAGGPGDYGVDLWIALRNYEEKHLSWSVNTWDMGVALGLA